MDFKQSPQNFVRLLKALSDPPALSKIQIARQAWDDSSFYVPNKDEVIVDWILTRFLKDKANEPTTLDVRYWELLADVAAPENGRPVKSWLVPLLNRIPIASITIAFLSFVHTLRSDDLRDISPVVRRCLDILWPLAVHKINPQVLLDCFGAVLGVFAKGAVDEHLGSIAAMVTSSYRAALGNASNKKKLFSILVQSHLHNWLECVKSLDDPNIDSSSRGLFDNIYAAGIETFFNLDILRQSKGHDPNSEPENPLFESLGKSDPLTLVFCVLPRLFTSAIQSLRRHRTALFSQGSSSQAGPGASTEEMRVVAMKYLASCCTLLDRASDNEQSWIARVALLSTVDAEKLFSRQEEAEELLKQNVELAITALDGAWQVGRHEGTKLALEVLSALARIDYDLVSAAVPRILPRLLLVHESANTTALNFLDLLLDFHSKTRTIHSHISILLLALHSDAFLSSSPANGPRCTYQVASSGPILSLTHLDRLAKSVHAFLTPGQTAEIVGSVLQALKDAWDRFYASEQRTSADNGEGARKKRKLQTQDQTNSDPELEAVTFSLSTRLGATVLSSLPVQSLPNFLRTEIQQLLDEAQTGFVQTVLNKTFKTIRKRESARGEVWGSQTVATAALRFQYVMNMVRQPQLCLQPRWPEEKLATKMLDIVSEDGVLPELVVEMYRTLLAQSASNDTLELKVVLDSLLGYLDRWPFTADVNWSGLSCQLTLGENEKSSVALVHLLVDRWLPAVDALASEQQLQRFAQLLMAIDIDQPSSGDGIRSSWILCRALRSAQFWELHNLRTALLSSIASDTSIFDESDISQLFSRSAQAPSLDIRRVCKAVSTYEKLLFFPIEYLRRSTRGDLTRRALAADALFGLVLGDPVNSRMYNSQSVTILRTFLKRIFQHLGSVEHAHVCGYLEHMLNSARIPTEQSSAYTSVTLDLIEMHLSELLRSPEENNASGLSAIILSLSSALPFGNVSMEQVQQCKVLQCGILRMIDLITRDTSPAFPAQIRVSAGNLYEALLATLLPSVSALVEGEKLPEDILDQSESFAAWRRVIALQRWLQLSNPALPHIGPRLVTKILSSLHITVSVSPPDARAQRLCVVAFTIMLEELRNSFDADHPTHLDVAVAAYVSLACLLEPDGRMELDGHMSKSCKLLSAADFSRVLDLLSHALASNKYALSELACVIQLSALMLREAPQGTLKPVQTFMTQCLNLFASRSIFSSGPLPLRLQVLDFVAKYASDRPAAIRFVDLSSIWSLLSKFLIGSLHHDEQTSSMTFHQILTIVSALIRLRRDLVVSTLPHLGMILQQLITSVRSVRPQLGAKQSRLVMNTLPLWINANQPLAAEEGKALARLLTTLVTKSVTRTHLTSSESQKAESLAKPFSKHAAYVLKAYIDIMNDPLCVLPSDMRKELQPGLFALCDMLNEHSRDAMMVSALDAGGKATLKALWKEYDKQRYVGKG